MRADSFTYAVIYHPSPPRAALYTKTQEIFVIRLMMGRGRGVGGDPWCGRGRATLHQRNPRAESGEPYIAGETPVWASVVTRQMENKTEKTTTIERHGGSDQ